MDSRAKNYVHLLSSPPPPAQASSVFHFPPYNSSSGTNFPVIAIAIIGILATAFLLLSYYLFVVKCCLNWYRIDLLRRFSFSRRPDRGNPAVIYSPTAAVLSRGLDESLIQLIPIIRFRVEVKAVESGQESYYECAVCLSEFKDGEKLRVIPNCCHTFHIDCIDVWLQTNANCPLCRSSISSNILIAIDQTIAPTASNTVPNTDNFSRWEEDYVVIEMQDNDLEEPRSVRGQERLNSEELPTSSSLLKAEQRTQKSVQKKEKKSRHLSSMGDEYIEVRRKDEQFRIQPTRRSISMDSSSDRQLYLQIQEILQQHSQESEFSPSEGCSSRSVRRSFFSFNNGRR
ncbi:hypothetical protein Nepgr_030365 [Nepenthes gracilis]|uniref:RING-type E3 ubiquitin transferase n=1 Tax=Nepenthes gracilis TaxID=150966 RepID=A0AAD3TFM7_NEPGR|nr:hypothetical protein Nepgr_030365 [Nepenthes gracilis]